MFVVNLLHFSMKGVLCELVDVGRCYLNPILLLQIVSFNRIILFHGLQMCFLKEVSEFLLEYFVPVRVLRI
jgi:hypothetical protein